MSSNRLTTYHICDNNYCKNTSNCYNGSNPYNYYKWTLEGDPSFEWMLMWENMLDLGK
jgi:hypothetical protein